MYKTEAIISAILIKGPFKKTFKEKVSQFWVLELIVWDNGEELHFSQFQKDDKILWEVGDKLQIAYEQVKTKVGIENRIIKIISGELNMSTKHDSTNSASTESKPQANFFKLKGKAFYAHLKEPNIKGEYPSNKYQLDLSIDSNTVSKLEKLGIQIKENEKHPEMGQFVRLKANKQPKVSDENGLQVTEVPLVGNGSEVTVSVNMYDNRESNYKAGKGGKKCLGVFEVQLDNLIPYGEKLELL